MDESRQSGYVLSCNWITQVSSSPFSLLFQVSYLLLLTGSLVAGNCSASTTSHRPPLVSVAQVEAVSALLASNCHGNKSRCSSLNSVCFILLALLLSEVKGQKS